MEYVTFLMYAMCAMYVVSAAHVEYAVCAMYLVYEAYVKHAMYAMHVVQCMILCYVCNVCNALCKSVRLPVWLLRACWHAMQRTV